MVSCDICGKKFKNTQGLRGHKNFVHSDKAGSIGRPVRGFALCTTRNRFAFRFPSSTIQKNCTARETDSQD